jgi:transposase
MKHYTSEAISLGYGGVKAIHKISGVSQTTIISGKREIEDGRVMTSGSVRREGGGRKTIEASYPDINERVLEIVEGSTYGNPDNPLSWTTESLRKIQDVLLSKYGIKTNHNTVGSILKNFEYSKQGNQKMMQVGKEHPDRNEQFKHINEKCKKFLNAGLPVISVVAPAKFTQAFQSSQNPDRRRKTENDFRREAP